MKTKTYFLWIFSIAILSAACEKEIVKNESTNSKTEPTENEFYRDGEVIGEYDKNMLNCVDNDEVTYYVNNEEVEPGTFDPLNEDLYVLIDGDQEVIDGEDVLLAVRIRAFTTPDAYYEFGDENDIPLRAYDDFVREITTYIDEAGIADYYDATGDVTEEYKVFEYELANRYFPGSTDDRTPITLYKDYIGGAAWVHSGFNPFLVPGYNNTVSRYFFLGIYGMQIFYDSTLYRNPFPILWGWGWQSKWFHPAWGLGFLNDRASSLIAI